MTNTFFHLCSKACWEAAKADNTPYTPPTYSADGFTHLTSRPSLLLDVANHFYKDSLGEWILLVLRADKLKYEVKYEPAASVGAKETTKFGSDGVDDDEPLFPHLYGPIELEAAERELPIERGSDGTFLKIENLEALL
jgi:uncharacterized protein (DUF952 family)